MKEDNPSPPPLIEHIKEQVKDLATNVRSDASDSLTHIDNSIGTGKEIIIPEGTFVINNEIIISHPVIVRGQKGNKIVNTNQNANGDVKINSNDVTIESINLSGGSNIQGIYMKSIKGLKIQHNKISTKKNGLHIDSSTVEDIDIFHNDISSQGFGILTNHNSRNGKNLNIAFNKIYSATADAIELNNPTSLSESESDSFKQVKIIGNTLVADTIGSGPTAGFAIGIANTRDVVVIGNITEISRREALHIEDNQENVIVMGNVFNGCFGDGSRILPMTGARLPMVTNNFFIKHEMTKTGIGLWRVYDKNGCLDVNVSNNYFKGFNIGLWLDGSSFAQVEGTVIEDCNVAIKTGVSTKIVGTVISKNTPILIQGSSGSVIDGIVSLSKPTKVIEFIGATGQTGTTLKSLRAVTETITSNPTASNIIELFPVGDLMKGRLQVTNDGSNNLMFDCDLLWDGIDLKITNMIQKTSGIFGSTIKILISNNHVAFSVYTASSQSFIFSYTFEGTYYKET